MEERKESKNLQLGESLFLYVCVGIVSMFPVYTLANQSIAYLWSIFAFTLIAYLWSQYK